MSTYSKEKGCGFCGDKTLKRITLKNPDSKMRCLGCGAVFYNENLDDERAGTFTGMRLPISKEKMYEHGFNQKTGK